MKKNNIVVPKGEVEKLIADQSKAIEEAHPGLKGSNLRRRAQEPEKFMSSGYKRFKPSGPNTTGFGAQINSTPLGGLSTQVNYSGIMNESPAPNFLN